MGRGRHSEPRYLMHLDPKPHHHEHHDHDHTHHHPDIAATAAGKPRTMRNTMDLTVIEALGIIVAHWLCK